MKTTSYLEVSVYWPNDGSYGIPYLVRSGTLKEAEEIVKKLKRGHYGEPGSKTPSEIHVWRTTVKTFEVRTCAGCENTFIPIRRGQKFCSQKCAVRINVRKFRARKEGRNDA
jgi:hypothetical protein